MAKMKFERCPCNCGNVTPGFSVYRCKKCQKYWGCYQYGGFFGSSKGCKTTKPDCPHCGAKEFATFSTNSEEVGEIAIPPLN